MALRDTWHRALVYFGLAEDHDYGPEYEDEFEPETGSEEVFEARRERDQGSVRRLPTSRRPRRDEIDDIFADDEPIVDKARFSAFIPGTCNLDELLRARGIDTLIITGCLTNGCCESTARTGMENGYRVLFVADGTAAVTDQEHNATLTMFSGSNVAEVVMADAVVSRIAVAAEAPAVA